MCVALVPRCDLRDLQNSGGSIETLKQFLKICSDEDSLRVSWSCDTTKNSGSPHGKAYNARMSDELRSCVADLIVSCHCRGDGPVVGSGQTADAGAGDGATRPVAVSDARTRPDRRRTERRWRQPLSPKQSTAALPPANCCRTCKQTRNYAACAAGRMPLPCLMSPPFPVPFPSLLPANYPRSSIRH